MGKAIFTGQWLRVYKGRTTTQFNEWQFKHNHHKKRTRSFLTPPDQSHAVQGTTTRAISRVALSLLLSDKTTAAEPVYTKQSWTLAAHVEVMDK